MLITVGISELNVKSINLDYNSTIGLALIQSILQGQNGPGNSIRPTYLDLFIARYETLVSSGSTLLSMSNNRKNISGTLPLR